MRKRHGFLTGGQRIGHEVLGFAGTSGGDAVGYLDLKNRKGTHFLMRNAHPPPALHSGHRGFRPNQPSPGYNR